MGAFLTLVGTTMFLFGLVMLVMEGIKGFKGSWEANRLFTIGSITAIGLLLIFIIGSCGATKTTTNLANQVSGGIVNTYLRSLIFLFEGKTTEKTESTPPEAVNWPPLLPTNYCWVIQDLSNGDTFPRLEDGEYIVFVNQDTTLIFGEVNLENIFPGKPWKVSVLEETFSIEYPVTVPVRSVFLKAPVGAKVAVAEKQ
jgi:hypothetical protein